MSNIKAYMFRNIVVDNQQIANLIKNADRGEIMELLDIKASQYSNLKRGVRGLTPNGLLRLMLYYGLTPDDLATVTPKIKPFYKNGDVYTAVATAIKNGKLKPQPCEVCGGVKADAHHDDYSKPLEVRWLCRKHHMEHHATASPKK